MRFSYANERTFLAWNRTALALIAAGLAVTTLLPQLDIDYGRRIIGVPLMGILALMTVLGGASVWLLTRPVARLATAADQLNAYKFEPESLTSLARQRSDVGEVAPRL